MKQNMADVAVFAAVTLLVAWRRGEVPTLAPRSLAAGGRSAAQCAAWS